ncbi:MAG: sugar phosphate nucleotidyltransferase [Vicinamibacterales bacterium]
MSVAGGAETPLRALVLTAGLGTRLEPLTYIRAKAAVPVNGDTLVRRIIRWLVSQSIRDLVLNLHHLPASIAASVGDGSDLDARVRYSWENPVLGSAGGPRHALPLLVDSFPADPAARIRDPRNPDPGLRMPDPGRFLIVNGDTLTNVSIADMLAAHRASGAAVTIALIPNPRPDKYGGVLVSKEHWVTGFTRAASAQPSYHFIGVQIAESRAFESLTEGVPAETVNDLYPRMIAADPRSVGAYVCRASFRDIGTPADYLETCLHFADVEGDCLANGTRADIHPTAAVARTAIWDDVTVGAAAELVECIVCDGAVIPAGARYQRCAILPAAGHTPNGRQRIEGSLLIGEF